MIRLLVVGAACVGLILFMAFVVRRWLRTRTHGMSIRMQVFFALALIFEKWFFPILIAGAVLDLALYFLLPDVVECYDCKGVYRGLPFSPDHKGFDLAIHDKYAFKKKGRMNTKDKEETHE